MRRLFLVAINVSFNEGCPWTNLDGERYLYKVISLICIQLVYLIYVIDTKPHTQSTYNNLELVNESTLLLLAYLMISFSGIVESQTLGNRTTQFLAIFIIAFMLLFNFLMLLKSTYFMFKMTCLRLRRKNNQVALK